MGFVITDCANLMILGEIPSYFRSGFGCQTVLLRIIEDWKKALDDNTFIAAILMDLSKAFDCLPHNLLMLKLEAYGLSENSLKLLKSYLENRRQRIKIGNNDYLKIPLAGQI
jgi:hypothetical protein